MKFSVNKIMNEDLLNLLKSVANTYTFDFSYYNVETQNITSLPCKCLTMSDLSRIIEISLRDNSMQVEFYSTITNIFDNSLLATTNKQFNIIDRLLYILQVRAMSVNSIKTFVTEDDSIDIDFNELTKKLQDAIIKNHEWFSPKTFTYNDISITCDIPTIDSDLLAGEEFYKNFVIDTNNEEDVTLFLGQNFIVELAKCISSLTIQNSVVDFSVLSFDDRIKTIDEIPVILMQDVMNYNKNYKKIINDAITVDDFVLPINGSLFLE